MPSASGPGFSAGCAVAGRPCGRGPGSMHGPSKMPQDNACPATLPVRMVGSAVPMPLRWVAASGRRPCPARLRPAPGSCRISMPRQGTGSIAPQGVQVFLAALHVRIDAVADPSQQPAAIVGNGAGAEAGMVEAAQLQADHQDAPAARAHAESRWREDRAPAAPSSRRRPRPPPCPRLAQGVQRHVQSAPWLTVCPCASAAMCGETASAKANGLQSA